jgi:hypothetical protein
VSSESLIAKEKQIIYNLFKFVTLKLKNLLKRGTYCVGSQPDKGSEWYSNEGNTKLLKSSVHDLNERKTINGNLINQLKTWAKHTDCQRLQQVAGRRCRLLRNRST